MPEVQNRFPLPRNETVFVLLKSVITRNNDKLINRIRRGLSIKRFTRL